MTSQLSLRAERESFRHSLLGPLGSSVQRVVWNDATGEVGSLPSDGREIGMDHQVEHALIRNLGVVDLDLVRLCKRYPRYCNRGDGYRRKGAQIHLKRQFHLVLGLIHKAFVRAEEVSLRGLGTIC
jgi:hypothetical protein